MTYSYKTYTLQNFRKVPMIQRLSEEQLFEIEVVGNVLPFKTNNYIVENLIDWYNAPYDPLFILNFPQRPMLQPRHFDEMAYAVKSGKPGKEIRETANRIHWRLNPHPAGQMEFNVPTLHGRDLSGMQHKYRETVLFFPHRGQTCHAYCTFCFRWPQFVGISELKFGTREVDILIQYLREHPEVTDVLFTGGDPLIMQAGTLDSYISPLLDAGIPNLRSIRIGTRALTFWPYRFTTDKDAVDLLKLFRKVTQSGKHLAFMAHFNHPRELTTDAVKAAVQRIRETGAEIRTQSPLLRHINDDPDVWTELWERQVGLGCVPYYMFIIRDTGAQHYFRVPLVRAYEIFRDAYSNVSGLARTVRGPSMSAEPGKIQVLGINEIKGQKVIVLTMLQGRDPEWVGRPFFAKYDDTAVWLDDLTPAFGEDRFFFTESPFVSDFAQIR